MIFIIFILSNLIEKINGYNENFVSKMYQFVLHLNLFCNDKLIDRTNGWQI